MAFDKTEFRSAMSLYPTGVAVITTEADGVPPFGMTVNSFTSLSLEPPLIMWNLQNSSDTYALWHNIKGFAVNFLRDDQKEVSSRFARKNEHQASSGEIRHLDDIECPVLVDCLGVLVCKMHSRYDEGDHVIIIGEVLHIESDERASPLVFHRGGYKTLAS